MVKWMSGRRRVRTAVVALSGAATLALSLVVGTASASSAATPKQTLKLNVTMSHQVTRTGEVNLATMPHATAKSVQRLTAAQMKAFDRPLKTAAQLAAYRKAVLSHAVQLPTSTNAAAPPSKQSPNFLSSNLAIPQLVKQGDGINYTQSGCGCTPPDQAVGVSTTGIVFEGVNNLLKVYNNSFGTLYGPVTAQTFFAPLYHSGDFFTDPQITYDSEHGHWLISWLEINNAGTADYIDLAISNGAPSNFFNKVNGFNEYQIAATTAGSVNFCDYDTLGYDYYAVWVGCTEFNGTTSAFLGNDVYGVPISQMLAGTVSNFVFLPNIPTDISCGPTCHDPAYRLSPVTEDGSAQAEFITATDAGYLSSSTSTNLTMCAVTNTAVIQTGGLPTTTCDLNAMPLAYTDAINAPQPGTSSTIFPGIGTKQVAYYDGRIWFAMPIALSCNGTTEDGIWWGDVVPQLTPISGGYPQGINGVVSNYTENAYFCFSGGVYSYMPSIYPSSLDDAALVYNVSDATSIFPSIGYTGRQGVDAPGTMGSNNANALVVGGTAANTTGRWGDYSACALAMNFVVRNTVWCGGEYGGSDVWNTRLYELRMQ